MIIVKTRLLLLLAVASFTSADDEAAVTPSNEDTGSLTIAPVLQTLDGKISGIKDVSTNGKIFFSYHSIPYAEPPIGDLRFKDPVKVNAWVDVKDGSKYPPRCPQVGLSSQFTGKVQLNGEEDCLYLNVFTAKPGDQLARLPVIVFIHGGAFTMGGTDEYPPNVLMNRDIVLVTIQYRLGMLGFLSTEDLEAPGNYGLKDQTLAIKWIQKNIHFFGGDALSITLLGQSAGAASVHYQILTPKSIGLFKRAITMSGSALCPWASGGAFLEVAKYIGNVFNCTTDEGNRELLSCLRNVPAKDLVPVQLHFSSWFLSPFIFGPRMDGDYLPMEIESLLKQSRHKRLDLLTGVTSHEGGLYVIPMFANEQLRSSLMLNFPEIGPITLEFNEDDLSPLNQTIRIFDHYVGGVKVDPEDADNLTRLYSDRLFNVAHDLTSILHAKNVELQQKNVFRYELTYRGERSLNDMYDIPIGKEYVTHGDDLFYLFSGGPLWTPLESEGDLKMRDLMTTLWTNFAIYGDPTPDDNLGFKWNPVTEDSLPHLNLRLEPTVEDDTRSEIREFWASLPLHQNLLLHPDRVSNIVITPKEEPKKEESSSKEEVPLEKKEDVTQDESPESQEEEKKVLETTRETLAEEPVIGREAKDEL